MEYEKVIDVIDGLKVLLRNTQVHTYVMIEVDGRYAIELNADNWTELAKSIAAIEQEFYRRYNTRSGYPDIEYETLMVISNTLRVLLRNTNGDTAVMIEVDRKFCIALDSKKWINLKNSVAQIQQEFYKRFNYQYVKGIHPEEEKDSGAETAD